MGAPESSKAYTKPNLDSNTVDLSPAGRELLTGRGISSEVIDANDIRTAFRAFPGKDGSWPTLEALVFPYVKDGEIVNAKYRSVEGACIFVFLCLLLYCLKPHHCWMMRL